MKDRLISEPIRPLLFETSPEPFTGGEPVLPKRFVWRDGEEIIKDVLEQWKELSQGTAAMPDRYVRKHWYRIRTESGKEMKIYFERQARSKGSAKQRWWLFSLLVSE